MEEQEPAYDALPWSLLPDQVCIWLLPWSCTCSSVSDYVFICGTPSLDNPSDTVVEAPTGWNRHPTAAERKELVAAIATLTELPFVQVPLELDDDDLRTLSRLTEMETLGFDTRGLTDAGIASIQKFQKLNYLTISFDSPGCVSVEAIAKLKTLPHLEFLSTTRLPQDIVARIKAALPHVDVAIEPLPEQKAP